MNNIATAHTGTTSTKAQKEPMFIGFMSLLGLFAAIPVVLQEALGFRVY